MRQYPLVAVLYLLLPHCSWGSSSLSEILNAAVKNENLENLGVHGIMPDVFVAASPLIVAAVCSDGIALVAAHTVPESEKLLRKIHPKTKTEGDKVDDDRSLNNAKIRYEKIWQDLPPNHGGPYRINRIDGSGTHLLSAGWRADCDLLTEKIRSLAANEVVVFGKPKWGLPYGRFLAQDASLWMAQLSVSDRYRPLSCVGLLAACTGQERESDINASLWFVDATGAYRVRALAIGGGAAEGRDEGEIHVVAQLVNAQLESSDFSTMTAREGASHILKILRGNTGSTKNLTPLVPAGCEMEVAFISKLDKLQRIRLSELNSDDSEVK